jgi:hypothetical protein
MCIIWFSFMGKHLLLWVYTNHTWCLWFANDSKCVCCVQSFCCQASRSPSCIECSIVQASKLLGVDTIHLTHVQHKTIHKRSIAKRKNLLYWYLSNLLKLIYFPNHSVTIIKHTILDIFCILILQLFKFWKFKIETIKPCFLN